MRPEKGTYPAYYEYYIPLVKEEDLVSSLRLSAERIKKFIQGIPAAKEDFAYAPGKWSIKEVINHLCDTERIMCYRALRFARKDQQQPLSYEQDDYVASAELKGRSLSALLNEFETVRAGSISLFESFTPEALLRKGMTAAGETTVLALGFMTSGHALHHINVIKEKYL